MSPGNALPTRYSASVHFSFSLAGGGDVKKKERKEIVMFVYDSSKHSQHDSIQYNI